MTDPVASNTEQKEGSIFNSDLEVKDQKTVSDPETKVSQPDYNAIFGDKLKNITDDKGEPKYKDVMTALEALKHTQDHVKTLEEENRRFRDTQTQDNTLEQALQNISAKNEPKESTNSEGMDAEKLRGISLEAIQEYEQSKLIASNKQVVNDSLVQKYGSVEKASAAYTEKANELGISVERLVDLASASPKAVLKYFDAPTIGATPTAVKGSINTQALKTPEAPDVDYAARFFNSQNPVTEKWRAAGLDKTNS